ncbi:BrnT family toxin [Methylolobus aquaticus]
MHDSALINERMCYMPDPEHSRDEPSYHAPGKTDDGRFLQITFTVRASGRLIRVISARDMHRKERTFYGQAKENPT